MFEQHSDQWEQIHSFSIDTTTGRFITLGISNDLLYVCALYDDKIDAYTLKGAFRFTTGKQGKSASGDLYWPRICDTDASGAALIADCGNHRLQVLSANGQWSIVPLDPPVKRPWGACFVNDALYVCHGTNISCYNCE